ncbi:uncharacterized protein [Procambarus clarkii]|uniref:uncharacterized protein isoform X3 n=1 Tax=Procambarus clarkii TaxID=6728 RepID=UPI0037420A5E
MTRTVPRLVATGQLTFLQGFSCRRVLCFLLVLVAAQERLASATNPTIRSNTDDSSSSNADIPWSTDDDSSSNTDIPWSTDDPFFYSQSEPELIIPSCTSRVATDCFLASPRPMGWQAAHTFCRSHGGFLTGRKELRPLTHAWRTRNMTWLEENLTKHFGFLTWPVGNVTFHDVTWTALSQHGGHYQWMSQYPACPAAMGDFVPWMDPPFPWSRDCAAFNLLTNSFQLHPCNSTLNFFCLLRTPPSEIDFSDVELRVRANMDVRDGWVSVSEEAFQYLSLTCTAHHISTGSTLTRQPPVFWSKDEVYISSLTQVEFPALVHDSTKSWMEEETHMVLKQGTFWCEAWVPRSSARLVSNKVLVTLDQWRVFVLAAHHHHHTPLRIQDAVLHINHTFAAQFPDSDNYTVDLISVEKELTGSAETVFKYRYQVHIPNRGDLFTRVLERFQNESQVNKGLFDKSGYFKISSAAFSSYCFKQTVKYINGNQIVWPFSVVGKVNPLNYRCEISSNRLQPGHCRWNYTHGATIDFDPSRCKRFEYCPRNYTGVAEHICFSLTSPDTWETGFKTIYKNSLERGILDSFIFHQTDDATTSVYNIVKQLLETMGYNRVWLPVKRLVPLAPLTYMGPGASDYPYSHYEGSPLFNISWAPRHPHSDLDCLALDMKTNTILTQPCDSDLPFIVLIDVQPLQNISSKNMKLNVSKLIDESMACDKGWHSTRLQSDQYICFKMFLDAGNLTWTEADKFCAKQNAQLPSPNIGFLDWVYRQYLYSYDVDAVWMNTEIKLYDKPGMEDSPDDMINWKADTDYKLDFSVLRVDGWSKEGKDVSLSNVLCQKVLPNVLTTKVKIYKTDSFSLFLHIDIINVALLDDYINPLRCFANGRPIEHRQINNSEHMYGIDHARQGYFQCQTWMLSPFQSVQSNILFNTNIKMLTFAVSLLQKIDYTPRLHDSTFTFVTQQRGNSMKCVVAFTERLKEEFRRLALFNVNISADNFFYSPAIQPQGLYHNFHLEFEVIDDTTAKITEEDMFEILAEIFATEGDFSECSLASIKSTVGCVSDVTVDKGISEKNLTWPKIEGSSIVLPKELCITLRGEPVTRECVGDFLVGYHWDMPSGSCTGQPSNVTKQLWEINWANSSSTSSVITTISTLTANGSTLKPVDIHFVASKLHSLSKEDTVTELNLEEIVEILNNVMEADGEAFEHIQNKLNSSSILFEAFESIVFKVKLPENEGDQKSKAFRELVSVERIDLEINSTVIGYKAMKGTQEEETLKIGTKVNLQDSDAAIIFPTNLTQIVASDNGRLAKMQIDRKQKIQLTFAVYRNPKLFQDNESYPNFSVNTHIIQATYGGKVVNNLKEPVKLIFKPSRHGNDSKCVYWDFKKNSGRGGWSTEGCWKGESEGDHCVCFCNHLTCFAQLMNYNDEAFEGIHAVVLDMITIIGCSLSIISLLLVFTTFFLFKKWRRPLSNKILVNLSFSVFCSIVIFLAGIDQTWNVILCRGVAVALHYFILASFGWMLVEAVHQYLKFVKVVGTYIPRFMWKASVSAWGVPVLPIIVVLVYDSTLYDSGNEYNPDAKICWMSSDGFKYAFLPPLALTMAINLIMFCLIIYGATCGRVQVTSTMPERELLISQLRMAICVFFLLGFTWVFGILAIWKGRLLFSYLFSIFNTLQGFFLFLFHVFRERSARRLWKEFLSVITRNLTSSEQANSQNINSLQYKHNLDSIIYNQRDISFNPRISPAPKDRGSIKSAATTTTLLHSHTSFKNYKINK